MVLGSNPVAMIIFFIKLVTVLLISVTIKILVSFLTALIIIMKTIVRIFLIINLHPLETTMIMLQLQIKLMILILLLAVNLKK